MQEKSKKKPGTKTCSELYCSALKEDVSPHRGMSFTTYALAATEIQSKTKEQIPKATMPTVQMARANLVEQALWKVGSGLSLCLMNIAFTMSR